MTLSFEVITMHIDAVHISNECIDIPAVVYIISFHFLLKCVTWAYDVIQLPRIVCY